MSLLRGHARSVIDFLALSRHRIRKGKETIMKDRRALAVSLSSLEGPLLLHPAAHFEKERDVLLAVAHDLGRLERPVEIGGEVPNLIRLLFGEEGDAGLGGRQMQVGEMVPKDFDKHDKPREGFKAEIELGLDGASMLRGKKAFVEFEVFLGLSAKAAGFDTYIKMAGTSGHVRAQEVQMEAREIMTAKATKPGGKEETRDGLKGRLIVQESR